VTLFREHSEHEQPDAAHKTEPFVPHKIVRQPVKRLARGALACPACDLPVFLDGPITVSLSLECPFCRESRPARQFLRLGRPDTGLNEVEVRARMPV
jgi:hypothetical protein